MNPPQPHIKIISNSNSPNRLIESNHYFVNNTQYNNRTGSNIYTKSNMQLNQRQSNTYQQSYSPRNFNIMTNSAHFNNQNNSLFNSINQSRQCNNSQQNRLKTQKTQLYNSNIYTSSTNLYQSHYGSRQSDSMSNKSLSNSKVSVVSFSKPSNFIDTTTTQNNNSTNISPNQLLRQSQFTKVQFNKSSDKIKLNEYKHINHNNIIESPRISKIILPYQSNLYTSQVNLNQSNSSKNSYISAYETPIKFPTSIYNQSIIHDDNNRSLSNKKIRFSYLGLGLRPQSKISIRRPSSIMSVMSSNYQNTKNHIVRFNYISPPKNQINRQTKVKSLVKSDDDRLNPAFKILKKKKHKNPNKNVNQVNKKQIFQKDRVFIQNKQIKDQLKNINKSVESQYFPDFKLRKKSFKKKDESPHEKLNIQNDKKIIKVNTQKRHTLIEKLNTLEIIQNKQGNPNKSKMYSKVDSVNTTKINVISTQSKSLQSQYNRRYPMQVMRVSKRFRITSDGQKVQISDSNNNLVSEVNSENQIHQNKNKIVKNQNDIIKIQNADNDLTIPKIYKALSKQKKINSQNIMQIDQNQQNLDLSNNKDEYLEQQINKSRLNKQSQQQKQDNEFKQQKNQRYENKLDLICKQSKQQIIKQQNINNELYEQQLSLNSLKQSYQVDSNQLQNDNISHNSQKLENSSQTTTQDDQIIKKIKDQLGLNFGYIKK